MQVLQPLFNRDMEFLYHQVILKKMKEKEIQVMRAVLKYRKLSKQVRL